VNIPQPNWRRTASAASLVGCLVLFASWDSPAEQGILRLHYLPTAEWLLGNRESLRPTFPLWGYPLWLAVWPPAGARVLQVVLGAVVAALMAERVSLVEGIPGRIVHGIAILLVPWYALCGALWPQGLAAGLLTLGILGLAEGLKSSSWKLAAASGLAAGLATQFRSEALLIGLSLGLGTSLLWHKRRRLAALWLSCMLSCTIPWTLHGYTATGVVSPTASNGGMVAYITLGQLDDNPWHIEHRDGAATTAVREVLGPDADPISPEGDAVLRQLWFSAIREQPGAFARKVLGNTLMVPRGGLWMGETGLADPEALDVIRERAKISLGLRPNERDVARYKTSGRWDDVAWSPGLIVDLVWNGVALFFGNLYILGVVIGVGICRHRLHEPLLALLLAAIVLQWSLVALLQYHPRHVTVFALWGLPFAAATLRLLMDMGGRAVTHARANGPLSTT
jgi:hypothetical protein